MGSPCRKRHYRVLNESRGVETLSSGSAYLVVVALSPLLVLLIPCSCRACVVTRRRCDTEVWILAWFTKLLIRCTGHALNPQACIQIARYTNASSSTMRHVSLVKDKKQPLVLQISFLPIHLSPEVEAVSGDGVPPGTRIQHFSTPAPSLKFCHKMAWRADLRACQASLGLSGQAARNLAPCPGLPHRPACLWPA